MYTGISFDISSGGLAHQHTYTGAFLEHIIGAGRFAIAQYKVVEEVYGAKVNRDTVIAGIPLHDIFKPVTYTQNENGEFVSPPLANHLDHISLATSELVRRDFPKGVIRTLAAH